MKTRAVFANRPTSGLVARAQRTLGLGHREFGKALGSSERTAARWAAGRSRLALPQLRDLARLVYPKDAALAEEIASAASETLESLGIVAPAPPPPVVVAPPAPDANVLVDVVVCAAADALSMAPSAVRGALLAAFGRARELGLSAGDVEEAIGARLKASAPPSGAGKSA
jgi:hypothetical protein